MPPESEKSPRRWLSASASNSAGVHRKTPVSKALKSGMFFPMAAMLPGLVADPGHVVEVDVGMVLDPRVHGQDDLVRADRAATQAREQPGIDDVIGHHQEETVAGEAGRLADRQPVLSFPLVVPHGRDGEAVRGGL